MRGTAKGKISSGNQIVREDMILNNELLCLKIAESLIAMFRSSNYSISGHQNLIICLLDQKVPKFRYNQKKLFGCVNFYILKKFF